MNIKQLFFLGALASLVTGCGSHLAAMKGKKDYNDLALDELRIEIADIKHTLHTQQMEMALLEDKLRDKDQALSSLSREVSGKKNLKAEQFFEEIASLERKLSHLEKIQEKTAGDIKQLNSHANQTTATFTQYRDKIYDLQKEVAGVTQKLDEVSKLKSTITALSKSLSAKTPSSGFITYKVKSGDSLGKIAMEHRVSIETLKKYNDLENDRIVVGKELKIPHAD